MWWSRLFIPLLLGALCFISMISLFSTTTSVLPTTSMVPSVSPSCGMVLGVFSTAREREGRDALRQLWKGIDAVCEGCRIHPVFVLGKSLIDISSEVNSFDDIVMLEEQENMNDGKSFAWFEYSQRNFANYTWIAKADMDTFLDMRSLCLALATTPQKESYGGVIVNDFFRCGQYEHCLRGPPYFSGSFYFMSNDLITLLMQKGFARARKKGYEDLQTGLWVRNLGTTIHYTKLYSEKNDICKFKHPVKKPSDMLQHGKHCQAQKT